MQTNTTTHSTYNTTNIIILRLRPVHLLRVRLFGGFDSSRLLILRGGNSHVRGIL